MSLVFCGVIGSVMTNAVIAEESVFRSALRKALNPERKRVLHQNNGGYVHWFSGDVARAKELKIKVAFSGYCASACTMYLSLPPSQMCITPGTVFLFHRASPVLASLDSPQGQKQAEDGTNKVMRHYPKWVKSWIEQEGGLSYELIKMPYEYAVKYIQPC